MGIVQVHLSPVMPVTLPLISQSLFSVCHEAFPWLLQLHIIFFPEISLIPIYTHSLICTPNTNSLSSPCKTIYFVTSVIISYHLNSKFVSVSSVSINVW